MNCKFCKADCCSRGLNRDAAFCAGWIKMTNADRIRSLPDDKLADELFDLFVAFQEVEWSKEVLLNWLGEVVE